MVITETEDVAMAEDITEEEVVIMAEGVDVVVTAVVEDAMEDDLMKKTSENQTVM